MREAGRMNEAGNGVSVWDAPGAKVIDNELPLRARRHLLGRQPQERVQRQPLQRPALRRPLHVHQRRRGQRQRLDRQHRRLRDHVFAPAHRARQRLGRRPRPRLPVQLRQRLADRPATWSSGADPAGRALGDLGHARGEAKEHGLPGERGRADAGGGARIGPEKCVFIYNTNQNRFRDNWFEGCEIGIHFTAGSEGNEIVGNAFVNNRNQVKYVGTRYLDWSKEGRGNYWSDNPAFDLNGDGLADSAYRPNDLVDRVLWTAPQAKVLMNSPAVQVIRWAQAQFPALLPGGVVDSHPLMAPPARPKIAEGGRP